MPKISDLPNALAPNGTDLIPVVRNGEARRMTTQQLAAYIGTGGTGGGGGDLLAANNLSDLDNAATARSNIGLEIGADVQGYHALLALLTQLTDPGADRVLGWDDSAGGFVWIEQSTGGGGSGDLLAANNLSDVNNAATARGNLGLEIGADVQAFDVLLQLLSQLGDPGADRLLAWDDSASALAWVEQTPGNSGDLEAANNLSDVANAATARSNLGLEIGEDVQAHDALLALIAALTAPGADRLLLWDDSASAFAWVDPATLGGSGSQTVVARIPIAASDEVTPLTTGPAKVTFRLPAAFTLTSVFASVNTAPTGAALVVDINADGASLLSTKLSIDAGEESSATAATPAVIGTPAIAVGAEISVDIDQIGSVAAGTGLKVWLVGTYA